MYADMHVLEYICCYQGVAERRILLTAWSRNLYSALAVILGRRCLGMTVEYAKTPLVSGVVR